MTEKQETAAVSEDNRGNAGHNVAEINKTIAAVANEIVSLEAKKAEIQSEITEAKARVKGLGIKMADFNAALRLYKLSDEDRNSSIDGLRTCLEAMGIGAQGELFGDQPAQAA
ncbi:hypothetical protein [Hwanghaeella sp.]|uniref:hypothetical protein n=1 Tax=Hwanghaeella sp. TaxID=2605943 RepID=UPI003CCBF2F9